MIFRVMVVEDEVPIRRWIVSMLQSMPKYFEVCAQARDGEEALKRYESSRPDLIIADVQMPRMDGLQLLEHIKKINPDTEVVILSNYDDFSYVRTSFKDGIVEYFLKSEFDKTKLAALHETLTYRKKRRAIAIVHHAVKNQFIYRLLDGKEISAGDIRRLMKEFRIVLSEQAIAGMAVYIPEDRNTDEVISRVEDLAWDDAVGNIHIFLVDRPFRIFMLFNINVASTARRDEIYEECVRRTAQSVNLPVGSTDVLNGTAAVQRIVRQCNEAAVRQWFQKKMPSGRERQEEISRRKDEFFSAFEALYQEINSLISQREDEKLSGRLDELLRETRTVREFYPLRTNAVLEQVYCRLAEAAGNNAENIHAWLKLEDEARKRIEHADYEEIVRLLKELERKYKAAVSGISGVTRQVVKYIDRNYAVISSMQEIADTLNYNVDYLYRRFKTEMGMSFVNYLTQVRLEKAAEMMRYDDMAPAMAAEKVGYASVSYFNKKFKEFYGQTPFTWKKYGAGVGNML